jgi:hypothetical protein
MQESPMTSGRIVSYPAVKSNAVTIPRAGPGPSQYFGNKTAMASYYEA